MKQSQSSIISSLVESAAAPVRPRAWISFLIASALAFGLAGGVGDVNSAHAAAFFGIMKDGQTFRHPGQDPAVPAQKNETFRWSTYTEQPNIATRPVRLQVRFHQTFMSRYGDSGRKTVEAAFKTWENSSATPVFIPGARNMIRPVPATRIDLESVALHEIGHALCLDHPDQAFVAKYPDGMGGKKIVNMNFGPKANMASPYVGGPVAPDPGAIMQSTIASGINRRDLTLDDWAGVKFLFDPANAVAPTAPEPFLPALLPAPIPGGASVVFLTSADIPGQPEMAVVGTEVGLNIDIFAFDFAKAPPPGFPAPPTEPVESGSPEDGIVVTRNNATLAFTAVRFVKEANAQHGIVAGTPDTPVANDNRISGGCDIFFNTRERWFHSEAGIPELKIELKENAKCAVSWPRDAGNFRLESRPAANGGAWAPVQGPVVPNGTRNEVEVDCGKNIAIYRLVEIEIWPFDVTSDAGANGSISPAGTFPFGAGENQTYTATPAAGYVVDSWLVDGNVAAAGGATYLLNNIQANHTVRVTFKAAQ